MIDITDRLLDCAAGADPDGDLANLAMGAKGAIEALRREVDTALEAMRQRHEDAVRYRRERDENASRLAAALEDLRVARAEIGARANEQVKLAEMLRDVEWGNEWDDGTNSCPMCRGIAGHGHKPDCRLAALLASPSPSAPADESIPPDWTLYAVTDGIAVAWRRVAPSPSSAAKEEP